MVRGSTALAVIGTADILIRVLALMNKVGLPLIIQMDTLVSHLRRAIQDSHEQ